MILKICICTENSTGNTPTPHFPFFFFFKKQTQNKYKNKSCGTVSNQNSRTMEITNTDNVFTEAVQSESHAHSQQYSSRISTSRRLIECVEVVS